MSNEVVRPSCSNDKIHNRNEFELCYLRHRYIRKANKNPTKEEVAPYKDIISRLSCRTYFKYKDIFNLVGFDVQDIISTGNVHLVSFLGLFAIENDKNKLNEFIKKFEKKEKRKPTTLDIVNKNKAIFTIFLKQRFEDTVRICIQKARNIKGLQTESYYVFCGPNKPPTILRDLIKNYEKLGFKKISLQQFKSIRKKVKDVRNAIFKFNNIWYICIPVEQKKLELVDFCNSNQDPYDNICNMNPEQIYETKYWLEKTKEFNCLDIKDKVKKLKNFINRFGKDKSYKKEISTARKMLKEIKVSGEYRSLDWINQI